MVCFHAFALIGKTFLLGLIFIYSSSLSMEESSDISSVGYVLSPCDQFSMTTFFHRHRTSAAAPAPLSLIGVTLTLVSPRLFHDILRLFYALGKDIDFTRSCSIR